jgi:hypothetical protein
LGSCPDKLSSSLRPASNTANCDFGWKISEETMKALKEIDDNMRRAFAKAKDIIVG